ncbi:ensconsin isoform X5 [Drosophila gunungcola]|uniref:ensconsin isoform X5 n=1 Tax=Drosophila gunungcola TaxID=103775 RepID=UPI0022E931F0|nr:ensconsin isoform X5 [Drosophila gunungcola]
MASLGGQHENISNNPEVENTSKRSESREGSAERKAHALAPEKISNCSAGATLHWFAQVGGQIGAKEDDSQASKDREEKLKYARDRQNEERHRKIEELRAQAEAAQRYREQKEEERRRRIEEIRVRDTEKRHQVEERKKAIFEAEKERREYILKKNQERESRIEVKRRDRNSIGFAFGSSTPRLLDVPADYGLVSPSAFWGQRRSTSISNVAGASLSRRSSERELADSGAKKRASSSTDRQDEDSVDTSPMVFRSVYRRKTDLMPTIPSPRDGHYGSRSSLSTTPARTPGRAYSMNRLDQLAQPIRRNGEHMRAILERERRERELEMLDETASLGGGGRRGTAAARARRAGSAGSGSSTAAGIMSRSMTHLAGGGGGQRERGKYSLGGGISTSFRPLASGAGGQRDSTSKSMTQISSWSVYGSTAPPNHQMHHLRQSTLGLQTAATKKYLQSSFASASASSFNSASFRANWATGRGQQQQYAISTNPHRFLDLDPNSLLLMNSASLLVNAGSRSGNATPGGHFNSSRPGSAMSTSTNMSTSGLVPRRPATAPRKPRPASIAGTGMSLEEINKLKRDQKPPVKTTAASPSAQTTPKRTANLMSTSLIVTSSSSRLSSAEKKTPSKREPPVPKAASASKALPSRTASSERISRLSKEPKTKDNSAMTRSMIVTSSSSTTTTTKAAPAPAPAPAPVPVSAPAPEQNGMAKEVLLEKTAAEEPVPEAAPVPIEAPVAVPSVSKAEKEALNSEKTEEVVRQVEEEQTLLVEPVPEALIASINVEEKSDEGTEKETAKAQEQAAPKKPSRSKENSEVRELTPPEGADLMTASMMAKKITTEEEAKAALAERRRLAREEAERQAELERQRLEAERLAEIKAQEEEAERQRLFEEESTRLAEEQRRGEEERLRKAIEEAQQREEEEKRKREDEEKQRVEREEAEKKAKEEAEKQRVEVAERLKREEKEREERRKRVEAIMLRTRKGGAATTPSKDANDKAAPAASAPENNSSSNSSVSGSSNNSAEGSPSTADSTPAPTATETETVQEPPNSQAMYEQSVLDKENSLINSFSTMIIDENAKNLQQVSNGKLLVDFEGTNTVPAVANGNGHIENVNNKNDINLLQDAVGPVATQLIDLSIESQDLHLNNNNSLLTSTAATTTLVTADSHENKDISLL